MLNQFRLHYPQGSLTSELLMIDHGLFIVQSRVALGELTLATGLAAANTIESAEDQARLRALALLNLDTIPAAEIKPAPIETPAAIASELVSVKEKPIEEPINIPTPKSVKTKKIATPASLLPVEMEMVAEPTQKASPAISSNPIISSETPMETELSPPSITEKVPELILSEPLDQEARHFSEKNIETSPILPELTEKNGKSPLIDLAQANGGSESPLPLEMLPLQVPEITVEQTTPPPNVAGLETGEPIDFSEIIARSNVELKRLNWTNDQGKNYLLQTYGKRSRQLLSDEELIEFLQYLEIQPTPPSASS